MIAVRIFVGVAAHGGTKDWNAVTVVQIIKPNLNTYKPLIFSTQLNKQRLIKFMIPIPDFNSSSDSQP